MITLVSLDGEVFVWSADDWYTLRKNHRICGSLIGTLGILPHQDNLLALPLALTPEESHLLIHVEKIAHLVDYKSFKEKPSGDLKEKFEEFRKQSFLDQVKYFQEERKKKITSMVDIIVEGKRRKMMGLETKKAKRRKLSLTSSVEVGPSNAEDVELPDRDSIIKDELNKVVPISEDVSLIQVPTVCPFLKDLAVTEVQYPMPSRRIDWLRAKVFAALWHQGFFVTSGQKFGGDFLAYAGDPMKFHAQYIVTCRLPEENIPALEIIALCRVGATVKKAIVMATFEADGSGEDVVKFETLSWLT